VFANGDPLVAWHDSAGKLFTQRFRVATQAWDAAAAVPDMTIGGQVVSFALLIDSADHVTVAHAGATGAFAIARDLGAGWTTPTSLGAGDTARHVVILDRASGNLASLASTGSSYLIGLAAANSASWQTTAVAWPFQGAAFGDFAFDGSHVTLGHMVYGVSATTTYPAGAYAELCR
jgi:hypothetical protein